MALPNIYNIEGFTWCGTSVSVLLSRYNQPQSSGGTSIGAGQGRFSGNALGVNGGGYTQNFNIPAGPFAAPIRMGFAVKSSNWPTPGMLMAFGDSGSGLPGGHQNVYAACGVDLLGRLTILQWPFNLLNQGVLQATGTHILQNNSYYYIEFEILGISASSTVNVYLDGVLEATATFDTRGAGGLSGNVYEFYLCCPQAGAQYYFCDGYVADTLLGPSRAVDATPTGDGALSQWTPSVAGPHYLLVNEEPPDGDTTYVSSATPGQIDLYTFAPLASSPAAILGVQVAFYARKDDIAARTIAPEVRSGGTNYAGTTQPALTTSYLDIYLEVYNADPHTTVAWLPAGLNAAQFGVNEVS